MVARSWRARLTTFEIILLFVSGTTRNYPLVICVCLISIPLSLSFSLFSKLIFSILYNRMGLTSSTNQQGPPASKRRIASGSSNTTATTTTNPDYPPLHSHNASFNMNGTDMRANLPAPAPPSSDPLKPPRLSRRERSHYCFHVDISQHYQSLLPHLHKYIVAYGSSYSEFLDINVTHIITDKSKNVVEASGLVKKFGTKLLSLNEFLIKVLGSYQRITCAVNGTVTSTSSRPPLSPTLKKAALEALAMIQSGLKSRPSPNLGQLLAEERFRRMGPAASALSCQPGNPSNPPNTAGAGNGVGVSGQTPSTTSNINQIYNHHPHLLQHHLHAQKPVGTPSSRLLFNGVHDFSNITSAAMLQQKILQQQQIDDIQMQNYLQRVAYNSTSSLKPASNVRLDASAVCSPYVNPNINKNTMKRRHPEAAGTPSPSPSPSSSSTGTSKSSQLLGVHMGKNVTFQTFTHPFVLLEEVTNNYSPVYREYPPTIITLPPATAATTDAHKNFSSNNNTTKPEKIIRPTYPILHLKTMEMHCPWVVSQRFNIRQEDIAMTKVTIEQYKLEDCLVWKAPLIPSHGNMFNLERNVRWDKRAFLKTWETLTARGREDRLRRASLKVEPLNVGLAPLPILHPTPLSLSATSKGPGEVGGAGGSAAAAAASITTANNLRPRPGFCECCFEKYPNLEEHVSSESHRKLVVSKDFYRHVDKVIASLVRKDVRTPSSPTSPRTIAIKESGPIGRSSKYAGGGGGSSIPLRNITNSTSYNDLHYKSKNQQQQQQQKLIDPDDEDVFGNDSGDEEEADNMMRIGGGGGSRTPILSSPSLKRRRSHRNVVSGGVTVDSFILNIPQL